MAKGGRKPKAAQPTPAPVAEPAPLAPTAPRQPSHLEFPCLTFTQDDHTLALFTCQAKQLWDVVKINRREENKQVGYQRALSTSRAEKIAKFIDDGNILPTSVLVSFDEGEIRNEGKLLVVPNRDDAGWVIDGQHRIEGAHRAHEDITIAAVAFVGLDIVEQIKCFITVNREQVGVPSSLYYELLRHLPGAKSEAELTKERATDLANELKNDETSPFFGRIVVTIAPKKGELSLTNFVRKLHPLLKLGSGRLTTLPDEARKGILNNYYKALGQVFPAEYNSQETIFFKTIGFGGLINALPTFLDLTLQHQHGFRVTDAVEMFKRIDRFNWNAWHQMGTGNAAEISAGNELVTALQDSFDRTDPGGIILD